jgi:hypothetical protein
MSHLLCLWTPLESKFKTFSPVESDCAFWEWRHCSNGQSVPPRKQRCVIPVLRHDQQCNIENAACASQKVHILCMNMIKANVTRYSARENYPRNITTISCISSSSSSSYVTSYVYQDLFRPRLLVCSKVFQIVFVHLVYNSTLFLASCCCSFLLHVVANLICIFLVSGQLFALSWLA